MALPFSKTTETGHIPIVDFTAFSISNKQRPPVDDAAVQKLAEEIHSAFSTVGFVYLTNHGISQTEVDNVLQTTDKFFGQSKEIKSKYQKGKGSSPDGWDELEREQTNLNRPPDLKESFDVGAVYNENFNWPSDDVVPNFKSTIKNFYEHLSDLGFRVLSAIAIGLNLDPDVFEQYFRNLGTEAGGVQLRFNYYPKVSDIELKPGQIRCGEHTDYGVITLLIQDDAGGLEVGTVDGQFVPATPIPGTILVNVSDLMQRCTSDRLKSTPHRVLVPDEEIKRCKPRRSVAFFFDPDQETTITCLDGTEKYPPVKSGKYIKNMLKNTYKY
ncbi:2-oxoglutarate-dependent dioxygenase gloC-like [Actinia tenebrosa]|uniref:2-oxoglutarate-dependent dioxygenase gloC-like n=1 Tax=Actinia tenebrosa TaxID=6105 RepID=A0A6P8JBI7_ACTTE|nr:2-oxoglutarate-dependent dioxygenase gloC-like [Actinia tenebrosa]